MLEDQLAAMKRASQGDRDELSKLRSAIAALDREKDDLQIAVDEKTEMEVSRSEAMAAKVRSKILQICNLTSNVQYYNIVTHLKLNLHFLFCYCYYYYKS